MTRSLFALLCSWTIILWISCDHPSEWDTIKQKPGVYPAEAIVSFVRPNVADDTAVIWVNTAYTTYGYKSFCVKCVKVDFDVTNPLVAEFLKEDSLKVAHL